MSQATLTATAKARIRARQAAIRIYCRAHYAKNALLKRLGVKEIYYAEYNTDRYLRKTFFPDFSYRGTLVEVGCATPQFLSMSQHFRENGWRCVGIEPNPRFAEMHRKAGHEVYEYAAADFEADDHDFIVVEGGAEYGDYDVSAHSYSSLAIKPEYAAYNGGAIGLFNQRRITVKVRKLSTILETHCPDIESIDILAVDVEGFELEVMKGLSSPRHCANVVVLENLFFAPSYRDYMQQRGYRFHSSVKYNEIYVRDGTA